MRADLMGYREISVIRFVLEKKNLISMQFYFTEKKGGSNCELN